MWFDHRVMCPKDKDGMANSAEPDQEQSDLIWVYTVFPNLSVRRFRISLDHKNPGKHTLNEPYYMKRDCNIMQFMILQTCMCSHQVQPDFCPFVWSFPLVPCEPHHEKTCFMPYTNNKSVDQPEHPRSLISTFVVCCLDSTVSELAKSKSSRP